MGLIISMDDFVGEYEIPKNLFLDVRSNAIINQHEEDYLIQILGVALFDLFKTAYTADPTFATQPRFKAIFDPIRIDNTELLCYSYEKKQMVNRGMKEMLLGFVYFDIVRRLAYKNTVSGPRKTIGDASVNVNLSEADISGRYNSGVDASRVIQYYIWKNKADYPEYCGVEIGYANDYF